MSGSFNIEGARKAGYSDGEIANFLASEKGFDIGAARKAGYNDGEITGFLASAPTPKQTPPDTYNEFGAVPMNAAAATAGVKPLQTDESYAGTGAEGMAPDQRSPIADSLGRIAGAAAKGFSAASSPEGEAALNRGGPLNQQIITPALKLAGGAVSGGMAALSQTLMEVFGEKGGRDALALLSVLPVAKGEAMSPHPATAPAAPDTPRFVSERVAPDVSQLDTRDAIQTLLGHDIMENGAPALGRGTANQSLATVQNSVMAAPDLDSAISAARSAAGVTPYKPVTVSEVAARDNLTDPNVAYRRAVAENAAGERDFAALRGEMAQPQEPTLPEETPPARRLPGIYGGEPDISTGPFEPQSLGAAASRDASNPSAIPEPTPAQRATSLQKMVNQSAEDRLSPDGRDDAVYVPGVERPEAMRDFSSAPEGEESSALAHKVLYNTDSNYHDLFDAQIKKNNAIMKDHMDNLIQDANARDAAMEEAKQLMPGPVGLFDGQRPVDAQPIVDKIHEILDGPAGKRASVRSQLNSILPNLVDSEGNLENLPSMLKGIRDDITDKLYDKTPTSEGNAARTARNQLNQVLSVVDDTIASGLPEMKYQNYLDNLSAALGRVDKLDYLQQFITGAKKITDNAGYLQFNKISNMLKDIEAKHDALTGGARQLSMDEIHQIEAVRNELATMDLLTRRAGVRNSATAQLTNAAGVLGSGPLGTAVKGAGELALHAGLAKTTGGVGNAALAGYRFIVKPMMEASKAREAAAELASTKQRLLDTTPRPQE